MMNQHREEPTTIIKIQESHDNSDLLLNQISQNTKKGWITEKKERVVLFLMLSIYLSLC